MKSSRILSMLLMTALLLMAAVSIASAQYLIPGETPEQLLQRADTEIFIKAPVLTQDYSEHQGYTNEIIQTDSINMIHEYFVYGGYATDMFIAMDPLQANYHGDANIRLSWNTVWKPVFHVSLDFQKGDEEPANAGRCWIRYSDIVIAGKGNEKGVLLYPGDKAYYFETTRGEATYTEIADLSNVTLLRDPEFHREAVSWTEDGAPIKNFEWDGVSLAEFYTMDVFRRDVIMPSGSDPNFYNHLDVIRIDGISFFYINGQFLFQYEDGIRNALTFDAGTDIYEGSIYVECNFDNFIMRAL